MVFELILYTLGIYFISKSLVVLIFKKPLLTWAKKLLRNKKSINWLIALEIILGMVFIALGFLF
jgi:hypothetical protein